MPQTILALLEDTETAASVLAAAALLQKRLQSGPIQLLHICHDPQEGFMPTEEVTSPMRWQALREQAAAETEALKAVVAAWQGSADQAVWHERTGDTVTILRTDCAMADFVIAGRTRRGPDRHILHTLLFTVRRATLITPENPPASLGAHCVVAWKDSPSADTVLRMALPLLQCAQQVTILIGDEGGDGLTEEPASLLQALVAANVPVNVHRFGVGQRGIGAALLQEAQAQGGDLLIMGAYTHSRFRELVLGGATRDVIGDASLPVLLAH